MRKLLLFLSIISFTSLFGQSAEEILYVIDSIAVINDPTEDDGELSESDIETLSVVTSKSDIEKYGYAKIAKIIFIITKEYARRPVELRKIPTTRQMTKKSERWHLKASSTPYSGPFIDYYFNGKKQGEGVLKDGVLEGARTKYFPSGAVSWSLHFAAGVANGESQEYFPNGKIRQEGIFKNGKEDGIWKEWYSTGQVKREVEFKEGKPVPTKEQERFGDLFSRGIQLFNDGNYSAAVRNYNKAIEINPTSSDVYFHRSRAYLHDLKFDLAQVDCDKAIDLEPLYKEAYSNRAFVRLRKHQFKDSRTLSKGDGVTILATKDNVEIPKDELEKMCADLNMGYQLGDTGKMIVDAMKEYCEPKP